MLIKSKPRSSWLVVRLKETWNSILNGLDVHPVVGY